MTHKQNVDECFEQEAKNLYCNTYMHLALPGCKLSELQNRRFEYNKEECEINFFGYFHEDENKNQVKITWSGVSNY